MTSIFKPLYLLRVPFFRVNIKTDLNQMNDNQNETSIQNALRFACLFPILICTWLQNRVHPATWNIKFVLRLLLIYVKYFYHYFCDLHWDGMKAIVKIMLSKLFSNFISRKPWEYFPKIPQTLEARKPNGFHLWWSEAAA